MTKILKSDLTYSLTGGFLAGALVLFFTQPAEQQQGFGQSVAATVSAATQFVG